MTVTLLEQLKAHAKAQEWDAALKLLRIDPAEVDLLRTKNEQMRAALTDLLWYVGQLEPLVYSADDTDEHETVAKARAALSN